MYEGKKIRLREHRMEDAATYVKWMNVYDTAIKLRTMPMPMVLEKEQDWIRQG